jgi:hypothetical protein
VVLPFPPQQSKAEAVTAEEAAAMYRFRSLDPVPPDTVCLQCGETGDVLRLRDTRQPGSKSETLHLKCAATWFDALKRAGFNLEVVNEARKNASFLRVRHIPFFMWSACGAKRGAPHDRDPIVLGMSRKSAPHALLLWSIRGHVFSCLGPIGITWPPSPMWSTVQPKGREESVWREFEKSQPRGG